MTDLSHILSVDTAPRLHELTDDEWDADYNCSYSADGTRLVDAENFPGEVVVREGCRILCDGVFAFQDYMAENDHPGGEIPVDEQVSFLDKISFPASLTHIGKEAFLLCGWLRSIRLPKSLLMIGDRAFKDCWQLESVSCPAPLVSIGDQAFEDCFSLYHVRLNKGLKRIGEKAFHCCEELEDISRPAGLDYIGPSAFKGCKALEAIYVPEGTAARFRKMLPERLGRLLEEE